MYNQPLGLGQRRVRAGPYQVSRPQSPVPSVFFLLVNSFITYQKNHHLRRRRRSTNSFSTPPGNGSSATVAAT